MKGSGITHVLCREKQMCSECCRKFYEKTGNPGFARLLDRIMLPAGLMGPFLGIPQAAKIWIEKDASSMALSTWLLFLIPASLWSLYGIVHREKPIIICNIAWMMLYISIAAGTIVYG